MADVSHMPKHLLVYWTTGPGGAKIAWNTHGDFMRCVTNIKAEVPAMSDRMVKGLCANLHTIATGGRPGHGTAE